MYFEVFAINTDFYSRGGPWGAAARPSQFSTEWEQLFAPVFREKFPAEVFCQVLERMSFPDRSWGAEDDLKLARAIEACIVQWNESHDDYAQYPSAKQMAGCFLADVDARGGIELAILAGRQPGR